VSLRRFFLRRWGTFGKNHAHDSTLHQRGALNSRERLEAVSDIIEHLASELGMGHLPSLEADANFDLIPLLQETLDGSGLKVDIVVICFGGQPYFFDHHSLLVLPGIALFTGLLVLEPAIIHKAANWGYCSRGNFDQIYVAFPSHLEGIKDGKDTQLLSLITNYPNFPDPDLVVYS
jgi:hypothetical protein